MAREAPAQLQPAAGHGASFKSLPAGFAVGGTARDRMAMIVPAVSSMLPGHGQMAARPHGRAPGHLADGPMHGPSSRGGA